MNGPVVMRIDGRHVVLDPNRIKEGSSVPPRKHPSPFDQLRVLSYIVDESKGYFRLVDEWEWKRQALMINLADLPGLVAAHKNCDQRPYEGNPAITIFDNVPRIRLSNACESVTNLVYSMANIAAKLANRISNVFKDSFNSLRKKVVEGKLDQELLEVLGDLQWYEKVREIRTEWAHHSSPFIGENSTTKEPEIVVRCLRRDSDRVQFKDRIAVSVDDLAQWASKALTTIDNFAGYIVRKFAVPLFNVQSKTGVMLHDENGWPLLKDGAPQGGYITVGEYMWRYGIVERYGTVEEWTKELEVPFAVLNGSLEKVQGVYAIAEGDGADVVLYSETEVRVARSYLVSVVIEVKPKQSGVQAAGNEGASTPTAGAGTAG